MPGTSTTPAQDATAFRIVTRFQDVTPDPGAPPVDTQPGTFLLELIKPSHYDDEGYVIQWLKAWIPSNSLASLYGLARVADRERVLGPEV